LTISDNSFAVYLGKLGQTRLVRFSDYNTKSRQIADIFIEIAKLLKLFLTQQSQQ